MSSINKLKIHYSIVYFVEATPRRQPLNISMDLVLVANAVQPLIMSYQSDWI